MKGKFYIIGVGPGDPELLTLKAMRILRESPVWFVPKAREDGNSTALKIIKKVVNGRDKEILEHYFPMKKVCTGVEVERDVEDAWIDAAQTISQRLCMGKDVVFPTMGDPAIYSTGFYIYKTLNRFVPDLNVEIVPGVSSINASAASAVKPLCLGDERMAIIPATFDNGRMKDVLLQFDTVVLMKVHRVMDRIVALLNELQLSEKAVLVEGSSHPEENIHTDLNQVLDKKLHYFSTIIVRKS